MALVALTGSAASGQVTIPQNKAEALPAKAPAWLDGYRVRWPVRVTEDPAKSKAQSVVVVVPTGGWLKPDASDVAVQTAAGQAIPAAVLAHDPAGDTILQFRRNGNDLWYWAYGAGKAGPKVAPLPEGLTVEVREWAGDNLGGWAAVREGLKKSETVIGCAAVGEVVQRCNPARPDQPRKFAASYRGFLAVDKPGVYRFLGNGDDATFLFIDGFKVHERPGSAPRLRGALPARSTGAEIELKAGVHPLELHHVVGNSGDAEGVCSLMWIPPGQKGWTFVPRNAFAHPLAGHVAAVESAGPEPAAAFIAGIDDSLASGGVTAFLVRFEAVGGPADGGKLTWDFGDGLTRTGRSVTHVYFKPGNYAVTLKGSAGQPPFRRVVPVWPAPGTTSPFSLAGAVEALGAEDWKRGDPERINQLFEFLLVCEQPERWPLLEAVTRHLLAGQGLDPKFRALLVTTRMAALAETGKAAEALKLGEEALPTFARLPGSQVDIKLTLADIRHRFLREDNEASRLYQGILEQYRRLDHPGVRRAAVRWGDLFAEAGDLTRAAETYRAAAGYGGERFRATAQTEAVTRGGLLRIAEQKLRAGDVRQSRQLLERVELDYPEQKLEGFYRFLRAESDRLGGRYEEALGGYELLLKLTQWAGFRDRAMFGIADAYSRMGQSARAAEWLTTLKESSPRFFEKQKLADYQRLVEARLKRAGGTNKEATFAGFRTGFEPDEKQPFGEPTPSWFITRGLGMRGPHVGLAAVMPFYAAYAEFNYALPVRDWAPEGEYWVELWFRGTFDSVPGSLGTSPHMHVGLGGPKNEQVAGGMASVYFEPSRGQWRKLAFRVKAPATTEGRMTFTLRHLQGVIELDDLSIRPISDRQNDSLANFLEGGDKP